MLSALAALTDMEWQFSTAELFQLSLPPDTVLVEAKETYYTSKIEAKETYYTSRIEAKETYYTRLWREGKVEQPDTVRVSSGHVSP